jgi:uncharacterized membrane protein
MNTPMIKRTLGGEQLVEATVAGVLLGYGGSNRSQRIAARLFGGALLVAAFAPALTRRLLRVGAARRRVHLRKTIEIDRPVHDVFEFCRDFENFPRVVQSLHNVVDYQDGRSRWEVITPGGETIAWDAEITKYVPNVVLAWRSVPGSIVDCNGIIRFSPTSRGSTRLQIEVDYDPRHTGLGDAIRALLNAPRTEQLEADLARANFYLSALPEPATGTNDVDAA